MTPVDSVHEIVLTGPVEPIPADRTPLVAGFTQGATTVEVPGFWDGADRYLVRFSPGTEGDWSWSTRSAGCASSIPRSASLTTSAGSLISFFIGAPLPR